MREAGLEWIGEAETDGRVGVGSPDVLTTVFGGGVALDINNGFWLVIFPGRATLVGGFPEGFITLLTGGVVKFEVLFVERGPTSND